MLYVQSLSPNYRVKYCTICHGKTDLFLDCCSPMICRYITMQLILTPLGIFGFALNASGDNSIKKKIKNLASLTPHGGLAPY